jgi:spore maturation protein CgeB
MFKNFEAMGAGCVLIAQRQPENEQQALGFEDMKHLVLYDDAQELLEKAERLRGDPALADRIAAAGQALVESRHTMGRRAGELFQLLQPPIVAARPLSAAEKVRRLWSRPFWR